MRLFGGHGIIPNDNDRQNGKYCAQSLKLFAAFERPRRASHSVSALGDRQPSC